MKGRWVVQPTCALTVACLTESEGGCAVAYLHSPANTFQLCVQVLYGHGDSYDFV